VILHEDHMRRFLVSWNHAKAASVVLPRTTDPAYESLNTLLRHVLGAARGYMVWMCEVLALPDPEIQPPPEPAVLSENPDSYLEYVLERAANHKGTAFVEIYQNCNIFNDGAYNYAVDKMTKSDTTLYLEHGKPLVFGKNGDKGIRLHDTKIEAVDLKDVNKDDLLHHDEKTPEPTLAFLLSRMRYPEFPEPLGVFRAVEREKYAELVHGQIEAAVRQQGEGDLQQLITGEETWTVE
jgi:2-oxoglutarate ferredoxin oxidoreductase subunit beta